MKLLNIRRKLASTILSNDERASAVIPVIACDDKNKLFLCDDNSMSFVFLCRPLSGADEKVHSRLNGFLNQEYPANTVMQFMLFRSPDIRDQMNSLVTLRGGYHDDFLTKVIDERAKFLQHHTLEKNVINSKKGYYDNGIVVDQKLIVSVRVPISGVHPTQTETEEILDLKGQIESSLRSIEVHPRALGAKEYIRLMETLVNWGADASWRHSPDRWEEDKPICEQIFDFVSAIEVDKGGLTIGDQHVRVLSAKKTPDAMFFGDAISYIGDLSGGGAAIKENYAVVCNVCFPDPETTKAALDRKRQMTLNQAKGPMVSLVPVLGDKMNDFNTLGASMTNGSKPVQISYSLMIFGPTKERADAATAAARNFWRESRFEIMLDRYVSLPLFINNLPMCMDRNVVRELFRYKTMTSEQAAVILPLLGEWQGTGTFHLALMARNGQLMSMSLHDSNTNKNLVIAAESGSGKSFLTNEIILSYMSEGAQVWVIDAGKSYEKLCELLDGDFVHFAEDSGMCLNPFELIRNYDDEEDAIVTLLGSMASLKGGLSEWQITELKRTTGEIWKEKETSMTIDDVSKKCLESDDQRLKDVGTQLYQFTSKGSYGKYFSGHNNVSFKKQFTVLELDELQGRKHLRQVVLLQLIYQIQQEVFLGVRNRKKLVIVDEAWDLLKEGDVAVFMEHAYRKFRKYGGSVAIATQSVNDLYTNEVGRAIAENSATMMLLGQTPEAVESVKESKRLAMTDGAFNLLKTVHTVLGVYSEIFVKSKSGLGVGRLIVSEFQKLLYSTDAEDVYAIQEKRDAGMPISDAINAVLRDRGKL